MDERLGKRWGGRGYSRTVSLHPSAGRRDFAPPVLIIAHDHAACAELERALPTTIAARSVRSASDTEGHGAEVVVIGGPFQVAEVVEVRAHPQLFDRPIVLFAPSKELPEMDWLSMDVWPVTTWHDPTAELVAHVCRLLAAGSGTRGTESIDPPHPPLRDGPRIVG